MAPFRSRRLSGLAVLAFVAACMWGPMSPDPRGSAAQSAPAAVTAPAESRVSADELMRVVSELASPRYEGRRTGTNGGRAARAFIRDAFASLGLDPAGTSGFEQPFQFTHPNRRGRTEYAAANLVGAVKGTTSTPRTIVITAHYDHVGVRNGRTYPGADDNASGIAALLTIARYIKAHPLRHPVLFVAFDAEELGLSGAKAFTARPLRPLRDIALNVNMDMVSRNDRNEIFAVGTYHSPWLKPVIEDVQRRAAVSIRFGHDRPGTGAEDWTLLSDHGAFHQAGVPFVYFGVEDHPDYHEPTDTADRINPAFFRGAVDTILEAIIALDGALEPQRAP